MPQQGTPLSRLYVQAFLQTAQVKYYYNEYTSRPEVKYPISTQGLIEIIQEAMGMRVKIVEIDRSMEWHPKHIKGCILKNEGNKEALIAIPELKNNQSDMAGTTRCERRFAVVKELCHILLDSPDDQVSLVSDLVSRITDSSQTLLPEETDRLVLQEYTAELAALELLFWHEDRNAIFTTHTSDLDIAKKLLIPECKVAHLRRQHEKIEEKRIKVLDDVDEYTPMTQAMPTKLNIKTSGRW